MAFFNTVEFYVILAVIAAAIVAFASKPAERGPAAEYLLAGILDDSRADMLPMLFLACREDGSVALTRQGVDCISDDGAVSLAVKVIGHDVAIEERLTTGRGLIQPCSANFLINFLPPGHYHIRYNSAKTGLFVAFPLHVRPGITTSKLLQR